MKVDESKFSNDTLHDLIGILRSDIREFKDEIKNLKLLLEQCSEHVDFTNPIHLDLSCNVSEALKG